MSAGSFILSVELRAGARLFCYPQLAGGHKWALTGARCVPVALDKICDKMVSDGFLVEHEDGERGEYKLWNTYAS